MLFSVEQVFVGRVEIRAPLKTPLWEARLLLTVTYISTTCAVVIFRVKVSCIMSVDGIKLWLLT